MITKIRAGVPEDVDWIVSALRDMAREYKRHGVYFDEEEAPKRTSWAILNHVVIVAENERKEPLGFILGTLTPHLYNYKLKTLSHHFWWVRPDDRMSRTSYKLLAAFISYGKRNADVVFLNIRVGAGIKVKTLRRYGFVPTDHSYMLKVR